MGKKIPILEELWFGNCPRNSQCSREFSSSSRGTKNQHFSTSWKRRGRSKIPQKFPQIPDFLPSASQKWLKPLENPFGISGRGWDWSSELFPRSEFPQKIPPKWKFPAEIPGPMYRAFYRCILNYLIAFWGDFLLLFIYFFLTEQRWEGKFRGITEENGENPGFFFLLKIVGFSGEATTESFKMEII